MKIELEQADLILIAEMVAEELRPLIASNGNTNGNDTIFDISKLADYLDIKDVSWVYRQVCNKAIPYFKAGKFLRFRKSAIDKWIKSKEKEPVLNFRDIKNRARKKIDCNM